MKPKSTLILDNEFIQYCELNKIKDIDKLSKETFNRGFSLLKYGETPTGNHTKEIIEVSKEIIKEVPVEVIKEVIKEVIVEKIVEVIKEVPVEIKGDTQVITQEVIKEVIVEKLIDDYECKNMLITLTEANRKLKEELETLTNALNKFNKGTRMKNSDLGSLYDE
jgi:DNA helicase-2/ATP-dependent DNA helicase PcrA